MIWSYSEELLYRYRPQGKILKENQQQHFAVTHGVFLQAKNASIWLILAVAGLLS